MSEKICMFCEHLEYAEGGHYEYAEPSELWCELKHPLGNEGSQWVFDLADFRRMILTAKDCPDYTQVKVKGQK